jgi:hypothetical protein
MVPIAFLTALFFAFVGADYFTNPASFNTDSTYTNTKVLDLAYSFTIGDKVQVSWFSPALDGVYISLGISHWDVEDGTLGVFISKFI